MLGTRNVTSREIERSSLDINTEESGVLGVVFQLKFPKILIFVRKHFTLY